jgi:hypothetical protein
MTSVHGAECANDSCCTRGGGGPNLVLFHTLLSWCEGEEGACCALLQAKKVPRLGATDAHFARQDSSAELFKSAFASQQADLAKHRAAEAKAKAQVRPLMTIPHPTQPATTVVHDWIRGIFLAYLVVLPLLTLCIAGSQTGHGWRFAEHQRRRQQQQREGHERCGTLQAGSQRPGQGARQGDELTNKYKNAHPPPTLQRRAAPVVSIKFAPRERRACMHENY